MRTTKNSRKNCENSKRRNPSAERKREKTQSTSTVENMYSSEHDFLTEEVISPFTPQPKVEEYPTHFEEISSSIAGMETSKPDTEANLTPPHYVEGRYDLNRKILAKIVTLAAAEVEGLIPPKKDWKTRLEDLLKGRIDGVRVDIGTTEAAVDILTRVEYGADIPALASKLKERIATRIREMTGLKVVEVNIAIQDIIPATLRQS